VKATVTVNFKRRIRFIYVFISDYIYHFMTLLVIACKGGTSHGVPSASHTKVHLFFFFRDNGQDGVYLAASKDAWTLLS
jgi:hypothetical protein